MADQDLYERLLSTEEGAKILGSESSTLKQSRYTGILFGKSAPTFIKMGRNTRYRLSELLKFRDQFPEYQNTSQIVEENNGFNANQISRLVGDGHE